MNPPNEPTWLTELWAKSADRGANNQPETLAAHTWQVLARLADFIKLRPDLPIRLNQSRLWHLLFWAAFLHDFGKAAAGFQARLKGTRSKPWEHRHEVLSLVFLDWLAPDFTPDEQLWLAAAIVSHHRDATIIDEKYPPLEEGEAEYLTELVAEVNEGHLRLLYRWLAECALPWRDALGLAEMGVEEVTLIEQEPAIALVIQQGGERIRHWLTLYQRFLDQLRPRTQRDQVLMGIALRGFLTNSDHSASGHYGALPQFRMERQRILDSAKLVWDKLFDHQQEAAVVLGSALLEAPTGSGKTEAALLWAALQQAPRLFYTLPYQASMNAMYLRLQASFGKEYVGLQHGRSLLALYREALSEDLSPANAAKAARASRDLAKLNYPPVRIFSPYQMLKGPYRLRGYEAQLCDYHGAAFIFDEIHAYEPQRLALILETMRYLARHFGARFFVMSATFPKLVKSRLQDVLGDVALLKAKSKLFKAYQRHFLHLLDGEILDEENIQRIVADARAGNAVLAVCNTVVRAQLLFQRLQAELSGTEMVLLHGRFHGRDRLAKEAKVRNTVGSQTRGNQSLVLVATQAVEVSLDIDLDILYSEPAPLEALIQRFGRINRKGKLTSLAPVYIFRRPDDGQKIYNSPPGLVRRTLALLETIKENPINEKAIGKWLKWIYQGEIQAAWEAEYEQAQRDFLPVLNTLRPFQSEESLTNAFYRAFDGVEVLAESLMEEYQTLLAEEPIRARELLVSIRWGQYQALANKGLVAPTTDDLPIIARVPYSSELGLDLNPIPAADED